VNNTRLTSLASLIIFVLAVIGTPVAVMGHWGHRTVVDQSTYLDVVTPLATDPEIQQAVADVVTQSIVTQVDTADAVDSFLQRLLPESPISDVLVNPLTAGVNNLINQLVLQFLASELFATVWIDVNTGIQNSLVRILEGSDGGAVYVQDGQLILDVSTLVIAIQDRLVERGYGIAASIAIEPGQRTVVLADVPGLSQIQFVYGLLNPVLTYALALLALAYGASIGLARRRGRQTMFTGAALIIWSLILTAALNRGQATFDDKLSATPLAKASDTFWTSLFANLSAGLTTMLVLGVLLVVIGFITGRSAFAAGIRQQFTAAAARAQESVSWQVPWIGAHMGWSRVIAIGLPTAWFSFTDGFNLITLIIAAVIAGLLVFAVQVLGQPRTRVTV
jgi:hypothetical protein